MYHCNYDYEWQMVEDGLRAHLHLGPTKQDTIFIPYIGEKSVESDEGSPVYRFSPHSFRIANMGEGIALTEGRDETDRIMKTGYARAVNAASVCILPEYTTCSILAQTSVAGKKEMLLAYVALFDEGQKLVLLHLGSKRPPRYTVYTYNKGVDNGTTGSSPSLDIDVMDGVEWHARLEARTLVESPQAMTFI